MSEITYKSVWENLSKVDVSDKIEKKMNLSYLSWAWAWGVLVENYPEAQYRFYEDKESGIPYIQLPDGTAEVRCRVSITDNVWREMWLPVMNHKNQAIPNPNARDVSDTKMRCLVKCVAMFGLGHYIYAGEDLPNESKTEKTEPKKKEWEKPTIKEVKFEDLAEGVKDIFGFIEKLKKEGMLDEAQGEDWTKCNKFIQDFFELKTVEECTEFYKDNTSWIKDLNPHVNQFIKQQTQNHVKLIKGGN